MSITIRLADRTIRIENRYSYLEVYCEGYLVKDLPADAPVDLLIRTEPADIAYEREKSAREDLAEGRPVRSFQDAYLETLAVYRKIAEWMPSQDTILFHGSVVAVDGKGYLFTAKSGTGKSTHTGLWRELFGERAVMVNDDKPLLMIGKDNRIMACGTPWDGKHRLSRNLCVPLAGISVLHRSENNRIVPADRQRIYPLLLQQTYRPSGRDSMVRTLALLDRILKAVPVYDLYCNMETEAAQIAYDTMAELAF